MKQHIFILLAALQLSCQERESPSVHTPDEVIQENYKRLSPGCQTEIKLQMEQICKVHDLFKLYVFFFFVLIPPSFVAAARKSLLRWLTKIGQSFRICKNGKCVNTTNNCEIDYFFP
ncbi:unnamed protein product [Ixodes pacificus]